MPQSINWSLSLLRRLFFTVRYLFQPPWDTGQSPPELIEFLESHAPGRAIDLGCGTGTNAIALANHGWEVVGIDFAPNAIRAARQKSDRLGLAIDFKVADVVHIPVGGTFHLVLDIGCLHSLGTEARAAYIENLPNILREGGTFLLYANVQTSASASKVGLTDDDLALLSRNLRLIKREDGTNRGAEPSAWLQYQRPRINSSGLQAEPKTEGLQEPSVGAEPGQETSRR